jgi:Holliday junction resolvase RusA-like endonuclease
MQKTGLQKRLLLKAQIKELKGWKMNEIILQIDPRGAPRINHRGRFSSTAKKYYAWCDELRALAKEQGYTLQRELDLVFYVKMPKSWSKKKRLEMRCTPHQQKPDLDNCLKAFIDAMAKEVDWDDCEVYSLKSSKLWWDEGLIKIK